MNNGLSFLFQVSNNLKLFFFALFPWSCRLQRGYCLIEVLLDFLVWLEASHLLSMVSPAAE